MTWPQPSRTAILGALRAHGVNHVLEPVKATAEGREWTSGLRGVVVHHTASSGSSLRMLTNAGGRFPIVNALIDRDGLVHVLSTLSCWGSGEGGPWRGVADKDAAHLVCWQIEVEDEGKGQTFTVAQVASLGRTLAALVSLGVPLANIINHRDWTDGTGGVGGYPLPTAGRKVDTRYSAEFLRGLADRYALTKPVPALPVVKWDDLKNGSVTQNRLVQESLNRLPGDRYSASVTGRFADTKGPLLRYRLRTGSLTVRAALEKLTAATGRRWRVG